MHPNRRGLALLLGAGMAMAGGIVAARVVDDPEAKAKDEARAKAEERGRQAREGSGLTRMSVQEAMAQTGTTSPSQALKALNVGRRGRNRLVYLPHVGAKVRAKGLKRLEKERARLAALAAAE